MHLGRVIEKGLEKGGATTATQMFELLDVNGSGQLSPEVLRAALLQWGCDASDHTLDKMIRYIDADGDGQVCARAQPDPAAHSFAVALCLRSARPLARRSPPGRLLFARSQRLRTVLARRHALRRVAPSSVLHAGLAQRVCRRAGRAVETRCVGHVSLSAARPHVRRGTCE